eukprot:857185-Rhodomonas_salina.1
MSGTDIAYAEATRLTMSLRACYSMPGTDIAYAGVILLWACYAMPGTAIAYADTSPKGTLTDDQSGRDDFAGERKHAISGQKTTEIIVLYGTLTDDQTGRDDFAGERDHAISGQKSYTCLLYTSDAADDM